MILYNEPQTQILLLCNVGSNDQGCGFEYTDITVVSYGFKALAKGLRTLIMLRRITVDIAETDG